TVEARTASPPGHYRPGLCRQQTHYWKWATAMNTARQATENMEYVRRLLEEKQAGFAASVELAVSVIRRQIERPEAEAAAGQVDWHQMAALVQRGCPPWLALRILR